jgi:hypothetical protein
MTKTVFSVIVLSCLITSSFAQRQKDSIAIKQPSTTINDSSKVVLKKDSISFMTPKKIGLYSAILPGFGQFKNKQYWKIPIIYIGVGVAAYSLYSNKKEYDNFRTEYASLLSTGKRNVVKGLGGYNESQLQEGMNYYQSNLDLTYVLTGVGYALQIIDAVVFAHLKGFDVSEDISIRWKPIATPQGGLGFGLAMTF